MSVLLIGLPDDVTACLIERLVGEDDEVRVLAHDDAGAWRARGAHIARGPEWDADLIERAAQNVRTIVLGDVHREDPSTFLATVVEGARLASQTMRVVVVGNPRESALGALRASDLDYLVLTLPRAGVLRRSGIDPARVAEAIDAADDLAGNPRLELDLGAARAWQALRLATDQ
jgi:hypothetical protein